MAIPVQQTNYMYGQPQQQYVPQQQTQFVQQNNQQMQQNFQYQQPQQQMQMNQQQIQPTITSDRIWVQGETGGKGYFVAKNTEQTLWDSEAQKIYIKTVNAFGRPSMVTLSYTVENETVEDNPVNNDISKLRAEFDELKNELRDFIKSNENRPKQYNKQNYNKKGE